MNRSPALSVMFIFVVLAAWELVCRGFNIADFILPAPSRIITVAVFQAPMILPHAAIFVHTPHHAGVKPESEFRWLIVRQMLEKPVHCRALI